MEALTLIQTNKLRKKIPIVLYDKKFWSRIVDWDFMVDKGVISKTDIDHFKFCNTVDESYEYLTKKTQFFKSLFFKYDLIKSKYSFVE